MHEPKLMDITEVKGATANIPDLKVFGNGDKANGRKLVAI